MAGYGMLAPASPFASMFAPTPQGLSTLAPSQPTVDAAGRFYDGADQLSRMIAPVPDDPTKNYFGFTRPFGLGQPSQGMVAPAAPADVPPGALAPLRPLPPPGTPFPPSVYDTPRAQAATVPDDPTKNYFGFTRPFGLGQPSQGMVAPAAPVQETHSGARLTRPFGLGQPSPPSALPSAGMGVLNEIGNQIAGGNPLAHALWSGAQGAANGLPGAIQRVIDGAPSTPAPDPRLASVPGRGLPADTVYPQLNRVAPPVAPPVKTPFQFSGITPRVAAILTGLLPRQQMPVEAAQKEFLNEISGQRDIALKAAMASKNPDAEVRKAMAEYDAKRDRLMFPGYGMLQAEQQNSGDGFPVN